MYSCTIRLTAVILRLAACLVLRYQAHILSLSGLLHVYSHSQACCHLFSHSHSGSLPVYSLTIRLTAYLFSCAHSGSLPIYSHSHSGSLPIYSHSHSGSLPIYSHSHSGSLPIYSHSHSGSLPLSSHYQAHFLSILTLKLLSICFHTQCC